MSDELTPERFRAAWEKAVEVTPRVLPTQIVLGPHAFVDPLPGLMDGLNVSLAEAFMHPERVQFAPRPKPEPPSSLAELADRWDWKPSECYCVHCGKQPVIVETGDGDYYLGPTYRCLTCMGEFCLG